MNQFLSLLFITIFSVSASAYSESASFENKQVGLYKEVEHTFRHFSLIKSHITPQLYQLMLLGFYANESVIEGKRTTVYEPALFRHVYLEGTLYKTQLRDVIFSDSTIEFKTADFIQMAQVTIDKTYFQMKAYNSTIEFSRVIDAKLEMELSESDFTFQVHSTEMRLKIDQSRITKAFTNSGTKFIESVFLKTAIDHGAFYGTDFIDSSFVDGVVTETSFDQVNFGKTLLQNTSFKKCRFINADLSKVIIGEGTRFDGSVYTKGTKLPFSEEEARLFGLELTP